jgi:superoxide reductase
LLKSNKKGVVCVTYKRIKGGCIMRFFKCELCGKIIGEIKGGSPQTICCGEPMKELVANTSDGATEKHVPVITVNGNQIEVVVGEVEHPMLPEHYIEWIALETKQGMQRKALNPGDAPKAVFAIADGDEVVAAYAYCNLHGLWKK